MRNATHLNDFPPPLIDLIEDELLTDRQTGRLLGVSPASVCRYRMRGRCGVKLPWTWRGRNKVTTRSCLDRWQAAVQHGIRNQDSPSRNSHYEFALALIPESEQANY
jgi:hypothetical protein